MVMMVMAEVEGLFENSVVGFESEAYQGKGRGWRRRRRRGEMRAGRHGVAARKGLAWRRRPVIKGDDLTWNQESGPVFPRTRDYVRGRQCRNVS